MMSSDVGIVFSFFFKLLDLFKVKREMSYN